MAELQGLVQGLHHITLVTFNEEVNRRFYTEVLGLRRVKLTVNQDDIYHRHLFYADGRGVPGSAITFFEWPELPNGKVGLSSPHHLAYKVNSLEALPKWKAWLHSRNVSVTGLLHRGTFTSLYLRDPDGVTIEITSPNDENISSDYVGELNRMRPIVEEISSEMRLTIFSHASPITSDPKVTIRFLERFLGLRNKSTTPNPDHEDIAILGIGNDERPDFLRYLVSPKAPEGFVGRGNIHHIAVSVEDEEDQLKTMRLLGEAGIGNSGIINRFWFKSLYFRDPHGNLLELATKGPGYTADEPMESLGSRLVLPPWLEPRRKQIEEALGERDKRNAGNWPPKYPPVPARPESLVP